MSAARWAVTVVFGLNGAVLAPAVASRTRLP